MIFRILLLGSLISLLIGCENIAVLSTPKKIPCPSHNTLATHAEHYFLTSLHQGRYQNIPEANRLLMAAYLKNPNDPQLAAHLGFLHIWQLTERERNKKMANSPMIVDHAILTKKYFKDATELNPRDARYLGFLGDSQLIEGKIFKDEREQTRGYFTLKKAILMWPQFNYFTAGYPMSTLPNNTEHFREALNWQWLTLDLCAGAKIDRVNPNLSLYMHNQTQQGPQRACWNSWIAPYNFEGFLLNMGDMLVKSGDWQTAIKIYRSAKLADNYSTWPYRHLLENRITHAKENISHFQSNQFTSPGKSIMFNTGYGCSICHQQSSSSHG